MNAKITKNEVARYFADELDRTRRREIESACRADEQVQQWFQELTPMNEDLQRQPAPEVRLDSPAYRNVAATTYLSVERDEQAELVRKWLERIRNWVTAGKSAVASLSEIAPLELLEGLRGTLLYREPAPATVGGKQDDFSVPPPGVPRIYPDYDGGRLIIRQGLDLVPSGVVEVLVVRQRGESELETLPPVRINLERIEPRDGAPYWCADVPLKSLIGDFHPSDDFIYCVATPAQA